jgi:hypothetical protein
VEDRTVTRCAARCSKGEVTSIPISTVPMCVTTSVQYVYIPAMLHLYTYMSLSGLRKRVAQLGPYFTRVGVVEHGHTMCGK